MLEIRFLGQMALHVDGRPVELASRPAQTLLAYLVLYAPRRQPRERLAGLLWPDADDASARQGLRNALWKLRAAVGDAYLVSDKSSIGFAETAQWWCDATALLAVEDSATDETLARTLDSYAGELLPGFYDEWIDLERERVSAAFERKIAALVARHEAAGRWREALDWSERWLARAGTVEPAYRTIMRAHAALGDRAGVGAAYRRCVAAIEEDLGLSPSEATVGLYQMLMQESGARPPVQPATIVSTMQGPGFLTETADRRPPAPPPAAREAELATLAAAFDEAASGTGRIVLVTGEAGEGKSTLLDALTRLVLDRRPDAVVARGACDAFAGEGRAFGPFSEAFRTLAGDVEAAWGAGRLSTGHARRLWALLPQAVDALLDRCRPLLGTLIDAPGLAQRAATFATQGTLPRLAELTALIGSMDMSGTRLDQTTLFDACAAYLLTLSQARPVVLLVDDLHWMDASSAGLLLHLSRLLEGTRLLIVGAYRPEEASPGEARLPLAQMVGELKRTFGKVILDLGRRDEGAARAFVDALLDREPNRFTDAFRDMLTRRTGGHALFTVELLDDLKERGEITQDADGRWVARAEVGGDVLPARVEGVLQSRLGRLDDDLRRALAIGAVEGEEFTAEVVARVAGIDAWRLLERLASEVGQRHRLVDEVGAVRAGGRRLSRFRFRHNLFQRFLYDGLGPSLRPRLHETVADALTDLHGQDAESIVVSLARHYLAAELPERALPHLLAAGRTANRMAAHHEAVDHLKAALSAIEALPPGPGRDATELDVQLELVVALHVTAGFSDPTLGGHARRAVALAEAAGDVERRFRALWNLWIHQVAYYDARTAHSIAMELLEVAGDEPDRQLQAHHAAWSACHLMGDIPALRRHLAAGAAGYDASRHATLMSAYAGHDPGVCRLCYQARLDVYDGRPAQALARIDEAIALARELGHAYGISQALAVRVEMLVFAGDYAGALRCADEAIAYGDAHGLPFWRSTAQLYRGWAQAWLGEPEGLAALLAIMADISGTYVEKSSSLQAYVASACLALGRIPEGLTAADASIAAAALTGEASLLGELHRVRAELRLLSDAPDRAGAEADLERAISLAEEQGSPAFVYRATETLAWLWQGGPRQREGEARLAAALARLPEPPPPDVLTVVRQRAKPVRA